MKIKAKSKIRKQGETSLITTIPKKYVDVFEWKEGQELEWILDTEKLTLELKQKSE